MPDLMERPKPDSCALCGREPTSDVQRDEWRCYGCDATICDQHEGDPMGPHKPEAHGRTTR